MKIQDLLGKRLYKVNIFEASIVRIARQLLNLTIKKQWDNLGIDYECLYNYKVINKLNWLPNDEITVSPNCKLKLYIWIMRVLCVQISAEEMQLGTGYKSIISLMPGWIINQSLSQTCGIMVVATGRVGIKLGFNMTETSQICVKVYKQQHESYASSVNCLWNSGLLCCLNFMLLVSGSVYIACLWN